MLGIWGVENTHTHARDLCAGHLGTARVSTRVHGDIRERTINASEWRVQVTSAQRAEVRAYTATTVRERTIVTYHIIYCLLRLFRLEAYSTSKHERPQTACLGRGLLGPE